MRHMKSYNVEVSYQMTSYLLHKKKGYSLEHLIAVESRDSHVEKEPIQNSYWDVSQGIRQEKYRKTNQCVRADARQPRFSHSDNSAYIDTYHRLNTNIIFSSFSLLCSFPCLSTNYST